LRSGRWRNSFQAPLLAKIVGEFASAAGDSVRIARLPFVAANRASICAPLQPLIALTFKEEPAPPS
jgi:hypothetical protein